ncbi:MAG: hypothetical protein GXN93_04975 [Candidatus Diapherotrites archaeon]|nr:hypothetical protein [Candidatus Diapherotrites archaeon]
MASILEFLGLKKPKQGKKKSSSEQFIEFCEQAAKKYPYNGKIAPELRHALEYLEWPIDPAAVYSGAKLAGLYAAVAGVFVSMMLLYVMFIEPNGIEDILTYPMDYLTNPMFLLFLSFPLLFWAGGYYSVLSMPISEAKKRFQQDMFPALRTLGYFVMSMKLVPNLEHGVKFATEHGKGFFADKLSRVLWNTQLGVLHTIEEGIDKIAYQIGYYSGEFKHALMRVRSSLMEGDDAKRYVILDSALREAKTGIKERMLEHAESLYMPSMQLFYVGVFLPLLVFIILPIGAAFSKNAIVSSPYFIFGAYDVALPLLTFFFARYIISQRPNVYEMPYIPDSFVKDYDKIRRRAIITAVIAFVAVVAFGYVAHLFLDTTPQRVAPMVGMSAEQIEQILAHPNQNPYKYQFLTQSYDFTPYVLIYSVYLAVALAIFVYLRMLYAPKAKHQADIMKMEDEFKDAVYVLASRMGEGKPLENALLAVNENLPETKIAKVFERIAYNIRVLGLTIRDAVFSPAFGVLKNIPSKRLQDAFDVLVSSVTLGTELAAKALVVLSEQLRDEEDVVKAIRTKLSEIAGMMIMMGMFIAPAVLGITIALEKVIMSSLSGLDLSNLQNNGINQAMSQFGLNSGIMNKIGNAKVLQMPVWVFLVSVGIYVLEVAALLTYFSIYLLNGRDKIGMFLKLGYAVLIAAVVYIVVSYASLQMVGSMGV